MSEAIAEASAAPEAPLEAAAGTYYRWARFIMATVLFCYGMASIHDGFYRWPADNAAALRAGADKLPHNDMGILINKLCGILLPPLGVGMVVWTLYRSRGKYRLEGGALTAPGHPPVPLDHIQALDQSRWDRKGIAVVEYSGPDGKAGKITLDDFVYERDGTDAIVKRIEQSLAGPAKTGARTIPAPPPPVGAPRTGAASPTIAASQTGSAPRPAVPSRAAVPPRPAAAPSRLPPRPKL